MKFIGKRGDLVFYEQKNTTLDILDYLPEYNKDHIIAGGAALHILDRSKPLKDIDIWISGDVPKAATRVSEYAHNFREKIWHPNVQYMKVTAKTPSEVINKFDFDACKVAVYGITETSYKICMHRYLQPLVYDGKPTGRITINPDSFNEYSLSRIVKYAKKFDNKILDMFYENDYAKAIHLAKLSHVPVEDIEKAIGDYKGDDENDLYELHYHLMDLFVEPTRRRSVRGVPSAFAQAFGGDTFTRAFDGVDTSILDTMRTRLGDIRGEINLGFGNPPTI